MSTLSRHTAHWVALPAAALLTVLAALSGPSAQARPPVRPGKITGLAVDGVTRPAAAYRIATSWKASSNTTAYRVTATDPTGAVLDSATVTAPGWLATVHGTAGTTVRVSVTPFHDSRRGQTSRTSTTLPDLSAPTGTFRLTRSGSTATVTQTALADDTTAPTGITRVLDWGDGTPGQAWTSGFTIDHVYAGQGLWRPTVTLTDSHGNAAVLQLGAVVVGDETAPTGTFAAGPATGWAKVSGVSITQLSIHDDFSADADILRAVSWGDGAVTSWPSGTAAEHVYAAAGTFTPSVELVDEAGNTATVAASPVVVSRDETAPTVRVRVPRTHATSVRSWRTVTGRATDSGTGVARVAVRAVEKRGTRWFAYRPATGTWQRAATRSAAWRAAAPILLVPTGKGAWQASLRHLARGRLVLKAGARDLVGNASTPVARTQLLTRR